MMRAIQLAVACVAVLVATAGQVQAGIITFTDRTAFESASGSLTNFDFNSEIVGNFTNRDFGDFTATNTNPVSLTTGVRIGAGTNVDGSNHLFLTSNFTQSPLSLTFDSPISAFGFDWRITDSTNDGLDLVVNGNLFTVSPGAPASGFFGILDNMGGTFTTINLQDDVDGGGFNDGVGFDNFSFSSSQVVAVPEPSSLAVFGIGACFAGVGAAGRRRREKHQEATA